jgi:hypothetical protein
VAIELWLVACWKPCRPREQTIWRFEEGVGMTWGVKIFLIVSV